MAVDMFLKLNGVKGESQDAAHANEIEILAWSWGMNQSGTMHMGTGGGAGKVSVQDISITKYIDSATHSLVDACCNGKHFDEATVIVRKAGGEKPLEYLKISMKQVLVSSISTGGSGGEDRLTENVSLNFGQFKLEYTPQTAKGSSGGSLSAEYNIAKNAKS